MYKSIVLQLMYDCNSCGSGFPVNGLTDGIDCPHCGHQYNLDQEFWTSTFDANTIREALAMEPRHVSTVTSMGPYGTLRYHCGHDLPKCPECDTRNEVDGLTEGDTELVCTECEFPLSLRPADHLARAIAGSARFIINERGVGPDAVELERKTELVLFACLKCGAGLEVDGTSRNVTCQYCDSSNYLPEGLWRELNPVPTVSYFNLILEDEQAVARRQLNTDFGDAAEPALLDKARLIELARHPNGRVREKVAKNTANETILDLLANDSDPDVLYAILDSTSGTLEGSARYEKIMTALAAHRRGDVRLRAAADSHTSEEVLLTLLEDSSQAVRDQARSTLGPRAPRSSNPLLFFYLFFGAILWVLVLAVLYFQLL